MLASAVAMAIAATPGRTEGTAPKLPGDAVQIGDEQYRLGKVTVDLKARTLTCAGTVNMPRGTIEYFACAPHGKLHESLLSVDVRPLHLQLGLILLGLEPKGGLRYQGDTQPPKGSPVDIFVSWTRAGRPVKARAEEMIWDMVRKQPMGANPWVFSGSAIDKDGFVADRKLSLIGTYRDPEAILNNGLASGSDDTAYKVNERIVPPYNTPVTLTLTPHAGAPAAGGPP